MSTATMADLDDIMALLHAVTAALDRPNWYCVDSRDFFAEHISGSGFTLVARAEGQLAGFLTIRFPREAEDNLGSYLNLTGDDLLGVAHMESAAVHPDFRGNHLQRRLVEAAEAALRPTDYRHWMATVHPENRYSMSTLTALGYRPLLTTKKYGGLDRCILCKENPRLV